MSQKFYLKPNVQVDPLFNQWYAWPMLLSPATSALISKKLHQRILRSFISSPAAHAKASKTANLKGGMFMDYHGGLDAIKSLLETTENLPAEKLAAGLEQLQELLDKHPLGMSLEPLYAKLPESVKGYIELGYDANHTPTYRLIEPLLYDDENYYDASLQSLSLQALDEVRPFVLSTPRLPSADRLNLHWSFKDERIDKLFRARERPISWEQITSLLDWDNLNNQQRELAASLFTTKPPPLGNCRNHQGDDIRIRYFGHATILIEYAGVTILTDPIIAYDPQVGADGLSFKDLPDEIDFVLITHNHQDHVMYETLLQIRHKIKQIIVPRSSGGSIQDPSLKLMFQQIGFHNVTELGELESQSIAHGAISGIPFFGEHGDLSILGKIAFHIQLKDKSILCVADSNNLSPELYQKVHKRTGDIDIMFIGMECQGAPMSWLYGPLLSKTLTRKMDQSRRLNGSDHDRALDMVAQFATKEVYISAMGAEPWLTFISSIEYAEADLPIIESDKLISSCESRGMTAERLYMSKTIAL